MVPDKQPNNLAATIPTPKHAPAGAGKASANPPAAGSSQVIHNVLQLLLCNASTDVLDIMEGWLQHMPTATPYVLF